MQAARIHKPNDLRAEEAPLPEIESPDQVKVRVSAAGICGSDLHVYQTGAYLARTPITMGHEFAGQIIEVGQDCGAFKPGDYVVGDSRVWCGDCGYCQKGQHNLCENLGFLGEVCEGAFAEQIVVPAGNLIKISPEVPGHLAALAEPLAVALHAVNISKIPQADRVAIWGAGPIGALIHTVLRIKGVENLSVIDTSQYRLNALRAVDDSSHIGNRVEGVFDLAFETTGAVQVAGKLLPESLQSGGEAVLVGLYGHNVDFNFTDMVEREWQFKGCSCYKAELSQAVQMLEMHYNEFEHIVSHRLPVSQANTGFDLLLAPEKAAMKIMLEPA